MELINWSLNATDTIFSTRKSGPGEPACPDGTHPAGYVLDAWGKWRVACLAPLSVEDVEDLYLFGFMVGGLLLLGLGAALSYRKIGKYWNSCVSLPKPKQDSLISCRRSNAQLVFPPEEFNGSGDAHGSFFIRPPPQSAAVDSRIQGFYTHTDRD